ncbi:hypothetical protein LJB71_14900 [Thermomonas sp. S9]|uniref:hypothetical protein n=1 Tax=Thermomonas sp. S9 TaxID=2885203 RepID=UPI00216B5B56|nr:hypothetical protein [Thermomonas sp. S9]MCR6497082.1 hypothetical protein [Thermomonas sp. S9]MCR6497374.1 hypothetical protein [Thermomonas sp. S9]
MREILRDNDAGRRLILERLYVERMAASQQEVGGFIPRRALADLAAHVDFLLATLAEQGLVRRDGDRYRITGAGCAHLESTAKE